MLPTDLPPRFARTMLEMYGEWGEAWLGVLPDLLADLAAQWGLTLGPPFPNLSYNYVAPATRADGEAVILKVGIPNRELLTEIAALEAYAGHGITRLLASDADRGALLAERLLPGVPLASLTPDEDARATSVAASVMRQLWRPAPAAGPFPTVADWARGLERLRAEFDGGVGPFPRRLVEQAEALFADLLPSQTAPVLLHGDLHHENILSATRAPWLALDPKGLVGEPAYEVGSLLRNPMPYLLAWPDLGRSLDRRVAQLADELEMDKARLRGWGIAQAVLSGWWSYEDHGHGWEGALRIAELLAGRGE